MTTAGGTSAASINCEFAYVTAPAVTGIDVTAGPLVGGTTVTITGSNLLNATTVNFGTAAGIIQTNTATQLAKPQPAIAQSTYACSARLISRGVLSMAVRSAGAMA